MATFAKKAFNASVYSSFRPTYPKTLFQEVFAYHNASGTASTDVAVDLGCGTGQAITQLTGKFNRVIGVDPSQPMVDAAREKHKGTGISFYHGQSEDLSHILKDDSVDLLISGSVSRPPSSAIAQAAHWFDWEKVWPEVSRVLRKDGTFAAWTYGEMRLPEYPTTTPLITAYAQGKDAVTSLGPYFERPGRTILEDMLTAVPDPTLMKHVVDVRGGLSHFERRYFAGLHYPTHLPPPSPAQVKPIEMRLEMRWRDVLGYFRTWSSLQTYHERFPEDLERVDERFPEDIVDDSSPDDVDVSGGDIAVRFWKDLREEAKKSGGRFGVDELVSVEWPIALLLTKKV
ncbi:hypothetical protein DXG01_011502 [Tephrocybe rancida]|nr:hypothetical protein DXG01_011502 [Tephrocybe rancida]